MWRTWTDIFKAEIDYIEDYEDFWNTEVWKNREIV